MNDEMNNDMEMGNMDEMLSGVDFPATKQEIMDQVRSKGAEEDMMSHMQNIPDREYESKDDLMSEMGM